MSLLKQDDEVPSYDDDEAYEALDHSPNTSGDNLDATFKLDTTDGFAADVDDDELSLDGIYDEDEDTTYLPLKHNPPPFVGHGKGGVTDKAPRMYGTLPAGVASSSSVGLDTGSFSYIPPGSANAGSSSYHALPGSANGSSLNPGRTYGVPGTIVPDEFGQMSPPIAPGYYPGIDICIVCQTRPPYSGYPTCGLTCAGILQHALNNTTPPGTIGRGERAAGYTPTSDYTPRRPMAGPSSVDPNIGQLLQHLGHTPGAPRRIRTPGPHGGRAAAVQPPPVIIIQANSPVGKPRSSRHSAAQEPPKDPCVVCRTRPCHGRYVTCGLRCAEELSKGGGDSTMCSYCRRRPKLTGHGQCGKTCADAAKVACLLCRSRPKYRQYHLCGKSCKLISSKKTPLLLEAPECHETWDMVQKKFDSAWKYGTKPTIKKIYKIIESKHFLQPYDRYKKSVGRSTEVFRYHGTSRKCTLGSNNNTMLCNDDGCALCCILKTSFKTSIANPSGAFGAGVYTSSAANKAYSYSGQGKGALILTKVVLGKVYAVNAFGAVSSCPAGYNSVVFDRNNGSLNETIVYSDDAIRPVFLIMFT